MKQKTKIYVEFIKEYKLQLFLIAVLLLVILLSSCGGDDVSSTSGAETLTGTGSFDNAVSVIIENTHIHTFVDPDTQNQLTCFFIPLTDWDNYDKEFTFLIDNITPLCFPFNN